MHLPRISMHQVREIARLPRILPRLPRVFATPANDSRCFLLVRVAMTFYDFHLRKFGRLQGFSPRSNVTSATQVGRGLDAAATRLRRGFDAVSLRCSYAAATLSIFVLRRGFDVASMHVRQCFDSTGAFRHPENQTVCIVLAHAALPKPSCE